MKAVKTKIKVPKKAERIPSTKDVVGESFIALFHDDLRLCEENLYTLFELKNEKECVLKLDMHSGELYLFKEGKPEKIDYSYFPTLQKNGGKGAGKYKHLNEKNWKTLVDKSRLIEIFDYHNPRPVLRSYPTDVTPPDFEAYYIKLYEGESEKCVYLRNVGEDNWRVFYAESFGEPLGFEPYALSEYVLKDILSGTDRRSAKGQLDCFDRLVGIDEIQYLSAFMPNVHEAKRPKGLPLASDDEGKLIVNAYYWKKFKSVPCADEDYILSLFNSLKEIAVNSVELEFEDDDEQDDLEDILNEIARGSKEIHPEARPQEQISEAEPKADEEAESNDEAILTEQIEALENPERAEQPEAEQLSEPEQTLSKKTEPEEEKQTKEEKPAKKKRFSLFGKKKKQARAQEQQPEAVSEQPAEEQEPEKVQEVSGEEKPSLIGETGEEVFVQADNETEVDEKAEPFESEIISPPSETEQTDTEPEEVASTHTEPEEPEKETPAPVTLEEIPTSFVSLADELLGTKPAKAGELPDKEEETAAEEPSPEPEEEFKLEYEPEEKQAAFDKAEPEGEAESEEPQAEEQSESTRAEAEEPSQAEEPTKESAEPKTANAEPRGEAEKTAEALPKQAEKVSSKEKKGERGRESTAFFELSSLVGAYSVAGRKKAKIKGEIIKALPFSPLIVPITAQEYSEAELVYVSKQCFKLCGDKIIPFTLMSDKTALLPTEENASLRKGVMVQTLVNKGKAYIPVFSDFKSAAQIFGANEKFGMFTLKNLLTHISSSETIQGITINPGTVNLKLTEKDFE